MSGVLLTGGQLTGIGLGPGDPDLMTVKAAKAVASARTVAYFSKRGQRGHARGIVEGMLRADCEEIPLVYPVTTEIPVDHRDYVDLLHEFYEASAARLAALLERGEDVALLCEGDPLFYGSFMHLYVRLRGRFPASAIAGVTGMSGCWTAFGEPMTWGDDVLTVLPGTLPKVALLQRLASTDACVVMKLGRNFSKVRDAIAEAGLLGRAFYVERGTMAGEFICPLAQCGERIVPYFALILIPGQGRRP